MENPNDNAVFFDSGIGGLNLLYECALRAPHVHYYYISDTLHVPYGNKSPGQILKLTLNSLEGIESLNPRALVIACNTVTAHCVKDLRAKYNFPVIGIQPAIKQAAIIGGTCLVLATEATLGSDSMAELTGRFDNLKIVAKACKNLAAHIENNIFNIKECVKDIKLPKVKVDSVVLGCTHYVFIKELIKREYNCPIFDGIKGTADNFAKIIGINNHHCSDIGIDNHSGINMLNMTFYGKNKQKNRIIFDRLLHNEL